MMSDDKQIGARLQLARRAASFSTAAEAAEAMNLVYSTYAGHENGNRGIRANLERYARRFNVSTDWLLTGRGKGPALGAGQRFIDTPVGKVRLVGRVGAGQAVVPFAEEEYEFVDAPPDPSGDTVAVEVRGESMLPAYEDGWLLYYSRRLPPAEMVNKRCVVQLADGSMLVKTLRRGTTPGYWNLGSLNAYDIEDQVVEWAAPIDWIKPR